MESDSQKKRSAGILFHPSSFPTSPVCGTFGSAARDWLNYLSDNGIGIWQFLPLSPTDRSGSPYNSPSGFAFNPWFLDVEDLVEEGFLDENEINKLPLSPKDKLNRVDFGLAEIRSGILGNSLKDMWPKQSEKNHYEFNKWCEQQGFWLNDHASFMELRNQNGNLPWWEWEKPFALKDEKTLIRWEKDSIDKLLVHKLLQWHLDRQWKSIKRIASDLGIALFGDLPFYVSRDSADVWSHRELFSVLSNGDLNVQSGVPPDYFSSSGQLWGSPVYRWNRHRMTRFKWWRKRFSRHFEQVDLLRLDHFRALSAYWEVSGRDKTAENGYWKPSPGFELLSLLKKDCGGYMPLIAEDLGLIDEQVESLRDYFEIPGMKILQFAFDGNVDNPYLPENIKGDNWIVYTGTHDNDTTLSWWNSIDQERRDEISHRFKREQDSVSWQFIELGISTEAQIFIAPMQDLLSLDNENRLNKPGTIEGNWSWRLEAFDQKTIFAIKAFGNLACEYKRNLY